MHMGAVMSPEMVAVVCGWMERELRYCWVGELLYGAVLQCLARCWLMVISSCMEGGVNVVIEALAAGVLVIALCIFGNVGMLGADYVGYYLFGNERVLVRLLWCVESDPEFYCKFKR